MNLVIESGGTKSDWYLLDGKDPKFLFNTFGLHPFEINDEKISKLQVLIEANIAEFSSVQHVYFYGAGCESLKGKRTIEDLFFELGCKGSVKVHSDLFGACVASCGNSPGVVAILGTGAIVAEFDGEKITKTYSGLGYMIGDEGSGFDLGRRLIKAYFANQLSKDICLEIEAYFGNREDIIPEIYAPDGRKKVAGLTKIISKYQSFNEMKLLINEAFKDFVKFSLYNLNSSQGIHFVGSIAVHFNPQLQNVLKEYNWNINSVHKSAIEGLVKFHLSEH